MRTTFLTSTLKGSRSEPHTGQVRSEPASPCSTTTVSSFERSSLRLPPRLLGFGSACRASSMDGSGADGSHAASTALNSENCSGSAFSDLAPKKRALASLTCSTSRSHCRCQ